MGFPRRTKNSVEKMQNEKIEQLEKRILELEKQCFDTYFKNYSEREALLYIAIHCQPSISQKVQLLLDHFNLQIEDSPQKFIINNKRESNNPKPVTCNLL